VEIRLDEKLLIDLEGPNETSQLAGKVYEDSNYTIVITVVH